MTEELRAWAHYTVTPGNQLGYGSGFPRATKQLEVWHAVRVVDGTSDDEALCHRRFPAVELTSRAWSEPMTPRCPTCVERATDLTPR
jgi:hypothetical protein